MARTIAPTLAGSATEAAAMAQAALLGRGPHQVAWLRARSTASTSQRGGRLSGQEIPQTWAAKRSRWCS